MELTIRINDEDYERLTAEQKTGISAVLGLSGSAGCTCHKVTEDQAKPTAEKPKRTTRKTKKEASDDNVTNTSDAPNNDNNGRLGISPEANDTTNDPVSSNEDDSIKESVSTADGAKSVEPVTESAVQETASAEVTELVAEVPSITAIQQAGAKYITANPGKVAEFQQLFAEFGIQKISDLGSIEDKIPQFVEALRAKGVEI